MSLWGKTDVLGDVPKFVEDTAEAYLVDISEAQVAANRLKGIITPGWNTYTTYTDATGTVRHKVETLVAMKVTAADAGDDGTTGDTVDEDAVVADE